MKVEREVRWRNTSTLLSTYNLYFSTLHIPLLLATLPNLATTTHHLDTRRRPFASLLSLPRTRSSRSLYIIVRERYIFRKWVPCFGYLSLPHSYSSISIS